MNLNDVVIVSTARTALTKSFRGSFNDTEAPVLGGLVGAHVGGGEQAVVPGAVEVEALVGGVHQGRLAEARARAEGVGLDHPELVQQLAHRRGFEGRQRQVVGAAGEGEGPGGAVEAPAGGVAEGLRAGEQQEVVVACLCQPPGRGEAGDAAADDGDFHECDSVRESRLPSASCRPLGRLPSRRRMAMKGPGKAMW